MRKALTFLFYCIIYYGNKRLGQHVFKIDEIHHQEFATWKPFLLRLSKRWYSGFAYDDGPIRKGIVQAPIKKRRKDSKNSFFGGLITKMFTDSNVAHLTFKLTQGHKEVKVIRIDNNDKECLIIGDSDGVLRKIKFDRKKEMTIKEQREIKLFEYE